ncbi:MAG: hypothetical protein AAF799_47955 [Myxococcota bacterium]
MKALDYRLVALVCVPWTLAGCPTEEVPVNSDGDSGGSTATTDAATSDPTPPAEETGDTPTPATSTTDAATTDGESTANNDVTGQPGTDDGSGGTPTICGDNVIEGDEVCDLAQLGGETCESLGFQGGQLGCLLTCDEYNTLGCFICGNEVVDIAEDCEVTVPEEVTCETLGFQAGEVTCGSDCLFDVSECSICGDGIEQGPEQCDGVDLAGETCETLGFTSGVLGCNVPTCGFDYSGCEGGQYTQDFEGGLVLPPEFSVDATSPWAVDALDPINGIYSARSGSFPAGVGGITNLTLTGSFPVDGQISFWHIEQSAAGIDFLEFYVDNVFQTSWSGLTTAAEYVAPVTAGEHTFQWRFNRAGFLDKGVNAVWVDDIILDGGVPTVAP